MRYKRVHLNLRFEKPLLPLFSVESATPREKITNMGKKVILCDLILEIFQPIMGSPTGLKHGRHIWELLTDQMRSEVLRK